MKHLLLPACLVLVGLTAIAAERISAPIEVNGYARVSSHDELLGFVNKTAAAAGSRVSVSIIGKTTQGRDIPLVVLSRDNMSTPRFHAFVFCSQHGNEPSGKEAALMLVAQAANGDLDQLLSHMDILLIPSVNPDGNEAAKRRNGAGADLNRDHLLLLQPETRAVHDVYNRLMPEATLDVHEFGAAGADWQRAGYVRAIDEQFGLPTNPNVSAALIAFGRTKLFPYLESRLRDAGIRFFNYSIGGGPGDTVRHSTTDINDGRQSLAIQHSFSLILEGRNGREMNDDLRRRVRGQLAAIRAYLTFAGDHTEEIASLVTTERRHLITAMGPLAMQMNHFPDGSVLTMPVKTYPAGNDSTVLLPYTPVVRTLHEVTRPWAYRIPRDQTQIIDLLGRHGVQTHVVGRDTMIDVEAYADVSFSTVVVEGDTAYIARPAARTVQCQCAAGDILVPVHQGRSTMIVSALEPSSLWGIAQYPAFSWMRSLQGQYPVYRVMSGPKQ
jgi:hypothetical protein